MRPSPPSSRLNAFRALSVGNAVSRVAATNALAGTHTRMRPGSACAGDLTAPARRQKKPWDGRHPAAMKISRYEYPANLAELNMAANPLEPATEYDTPDPGGDGVSHPPRLGTQAGHYRGARRSMGVGSRGRDLSPRSAATTASPIRWTPWSGPAKPTPNWAFMARLMTLCSLPRSNPGNRTQYVRRNGPYTLTMFASEKTKLPYGNLPRLLMAWISTEAVRTQSRELVLGGVGVRVHAKAQYLQQ